MKAKSKILEKWVEYLGKIRYYTLMSNNTLVSAHETHRET